MKVSVKTESVKTITVNLELSEAEGQNLLHLCNFLDWDLSDDGVARVARLLADALDDAGIEIFASISDITLHTNPDYLK